MYLNALGYKSRISSKTIDDAIDDIIRFVYSEIYSSSLLDGHKDREKNLHKYFVKSLGEILKKNLRGRNANIEKQNNLKPSIIEKFARSTNDSLVIFIGK